MSERDELVAYLRKTPGWPTLGNKAADQIERDGREIERLRSVVAWYGEQSRLCRLVHSEGDAGRNALEADGGKRAAAALNGEGET